MLVALLTTGCAVLVPDERLEPGWRRLTIAVDTIRDDRPAIFVVADDSGMTVGRAAPNVVAPQMHEQVTFDVPPGRSWKIYLNGAVVIDGADARIPITIYSGDATGPFPPSYEWASPGPPIEP